MRRQADWKARALLRAYHHQVKVKEKQGYPDMGRIQMNVGDRYVRFLARAAEKRGMSPASYIRRAVAAFISADLGVPFTEIVSDGAHPRGYRHAAGDDGLGYGEWGATAFLDDKDVVQES